MLFFLASHLPIPFLHDAKEVKIFLAELRSRIINGPKKKITETYKGRGGAYYTTKLFETRVILNLHKL